MTERDNPQTTVPQTPNTGDQITNVALQFMGTPDWQRDREAKLEAQYRGPGEFEERGLDKQDVASKGSMITSDPASTTPGEEPSLDTRGTGG